jgi:hypothetical protein
MTDLFILSLAVFAAVVAVRLLTSGWPRIEDGADEDRRVG